MIYHAYEKSNFSACKICGYGPGAIQHNTSMVASDPDALELHSRYGPVFPTISVSVHKAQRMISSEPVPILEIVARKQFPEPGTLEECRRLGEEDAKKIVDALFSTLPGVTLDQIVRFCLEKRATYFVVRF